MNYVFFFFFNYITFFQYYGDFQPHLEYLLNSYKINFYKKKLNYNKNNNKILVTKYIVLRGKNVLYILK